MGYVAGNHGWDRDSHQRIFYMAHNISYSWSFVLFSNTNACYVVCIDMCVFNMGVSYRLCGLVGVSYIVLVLVGVSYRVVK